MGVQIRDIHGEFKGADFRDDETQLMFAYDYKNRYDLRVYGHNMKPCLHKEMKRLGVEILDRVMVTALLTADGAQGKRVIGATGIHTRTGEFYILLAKGDHTCYGSSWKDMGYFRPSIGLPSATQT